METIVFKSHINVNGGMSVEVNTLTGGTGSNHIRINGAGTPLFYNKSFIVDFNFDAVITVVETAKEPGLEQRFHNLANQWRRETRHQSSASKMAMHPAYQQIIGMGREAIPLILRELRRSRGHWLWALFAITGEDPAPEGSTFAEAIDAWLSWGLSRGYATPD